jgi:hypothetical protein
MTPAWAQRQEELLSDCMVSPEVFNHMVDHLGDFVVPYQNCLETEAGQCKVYLYLQGLLSHLPRKNAEEITALVDVEGLVMQEFIGTARGIIGRWSRCWSDKSWISWVNPMASSPLIPAASRSGAPTQWG